MIRTSVFLLLVCNLLGVLSARADQATTDKSDANREYKRPSVIVPYAFSTEALETGIGAVYFRKGVFQQDDGLFVTGYGTSNSSFGLFSGLTNLRLSERLFFSPMIGLMKNEQQRFYGDIGFRAGEIPSGSNESTEDDFAFGTGIDTFLHLNFHYVLPIGPDSDKPLTDLPRTTDC